MNLRTATLAAVLAGSFGLAACSTEADTVDHNTKKDAESFKVQRKITFFNGITDKEMLRVEGRCSYEVDGTQFTVICKTGKQSYVRHTLVRSDNVSAIVEQTLPNEVDPNHYAFVFRPQTLIPEVDVQTDNTNEAP